MSPRTLDLLHASGWSAHRRSDVDEIERRLREAGYAASECARQFLSSFGDLEIEHPHRRVAGRVSRIRTYPRAATGESYRELVRNYEERVGDVLTVLGDAANGYLILTMDTRGAVYGCYDDYLARLGATGEEALDNLCEGRDVEPI